jgi:hypothetical protein
VTKKKKVFNIGNRSEVRDYNDDLYKNDITYRPEGSKVGG